jgi:hypothetical protein
VISTLLARLSICPGAVFYERELKVLDAAAFDRMRALGLLSGARNLGPGDTFDEGTGARLLTLVMSPGGGLEALDPEDEGFPPPRLDDEACRQWSVDLMAVAKLLQSAYFLEGIPTRISERLFFLGETGAGDSRTAFVLGLVRAPGAVHALLGLPAALPAFSRFAVLTPESVDPVSESRLDPAGIQLVTLDPRDPFRRLPIGDSNSVIGGLGEPAAAIRHNDTFSSVTLNGRSYSLTPGQACAVRLLYDARARGTPDIEHRRIIVHLHQHGYSTNRLRDLFMASHAWGSLVISPRRGLYRLAG